MSTNVQQLGKYELRERLGRGGMAEVWKAYDKQLRRYVAIKLLHADLRTDPDFMNRFIREARVVASLHHPNIVQIHDFQVSEPPATEETIAYMVMDYIEGQTLADYIMNTSGAGKFPPAAEIVYLFTSLGGAVDYAHQRGMIHRDIKPTNIILDKRRPTPYHTGSPMLTDFGIAKLLSVSTGSLSGFWLGTPSYIAPEQAMGVPGNERSDIYSLGIILYEICTGVLPFWEKTPAALMRQHIDLMPTSPDLINRHIPPALTAVTLRSLAKNPAARFPSASAMAVALAEAFNLPVPDILSTPTSPVNALSTPTSSNSLQSRPSSSVTPSSAPSPLSNRVVSTPQLASFSSGVPSTPVIPTGSPGENNKIASPSERQGVTPVLTPAPPGITPLPPSTRGKRRRHMLIALVAILIVVLLGSSLGALFLLLHQTPTATALVPGTLVGHAYFTSSGELNESNSQGIEDELQINLSTIPNAAPGKSYYAWLLNDKTQKSIKALFLGKLTIDHGHVTTLYKGDQQYTNLIAIYSRFLITEEDAKTAPVTPSLDRHTWRYYAEIPQTPTKIGRHFSPLDHIRHLLYEGPILRVLGIHGGSNIQLLKNTQKVLEWAASAKEAWRADPQFIHRQVVRILDYLDSSSYVQRDVPPGTHLLVDPRLAQVPLITVVKPQVNASYLSRIEDHVLALSLESQTPGIAPATHKLARQADLALINEQNWLSQVRQDAKQIVTMTDEQLLQPSTLLLLSDMQVQANDAFVGRFNPFTGQIQWGAVQIYYSIQQLATFDIKAL